MSLVQELAYADVFTSVDVPLKTEDLADFVYELIAQPSAVFGGLSKYAVSEITTIV